MATSHLQPVVTPPDMVLPPSPPPAFFGGNALQYRRDPLGFLVRNAQLYGDTIRIMIFRFPVYQINHPDDIQIVLTKQAARFHKSIIYKTTLSEFLGNGLLISDGEFWRRQRRLAQPAFHTQRIQSYADIMLDYTERLLETWADGQTRNIADDMMKLTLYIVAKTLFDADVSGESAKVGEALEVLLHTVIEQSRIVIRMPRWLPTPHRLRKRWSIQTLDDVMMGIISERRQQRDDKGDLLSMLMLAEDDEGRGMTDKQVRDEALTLFLAGHETTANALTWTWYLLSQHPEVEARLHAEVDQVLAGRTPTLADLANLPYTEQIIKESMRLYPPAWGFGRQPIEEVALTHYTLPKRSSVMVVPYIVHRDERWFPDPERFDPDRFSPENEASIPKYAYLPFGGGPRVCIGNSFALMEARLILASIASRYRLSLVPGHKVEPEPLVTLRPRYGMRMRLTRR